MRHSQVRNLLVLTFGLAAVGAMEAKADIIYALDQQGQLLNFSSATPGTINSAFPIVGLQANEDLVGLAYYNQYPLWVG